MARTGGTPRSDGSKTVANGGDRVASFWRWLKEQPKSPTVTHLVLVARWGDEPERDVHVCEREEVNEPKAEFLANLCQDLADENNATVFARLEWRQGADAPRAYASKSARATPNREDTGPTETWDGSMASILAQTQRHQEALMRQLTNVVNASQERTERVFDFMDRVLARLEERANKAEDAAATAGAEAAEATEIAEQVVAEAEQAVQAAEAAAQDKDTAQVVKLIVDNAARGLLAGGEKQ